MSNPDSKVNPSFKQACSFNFTRFSPSSAKKSENKDYIYTEEPCLGKAIYSIQYQNNIIRYILVGGVAFKLFSIVILYVGACSTEKDDYNRDNLKLTLCLATPGGLWYVCTCWRKDRGKEIVKETLANAAYRPEITGCLAFMKLLGDIGIFLGLFVLSLGVAINATTAMQWSGVALAFASILLNIKSNLVS